jgi:hypothetical protein
MAKNPMPAPREPEDLVQAQHDKIHEDSRNLMSLGLLSNIYEEKIVREFEESNKALEEARKLRQKVLDDYTPPGLPQDVLDIIEKTKKRATEEGRWR